MVPKLDAMKLYNRDSSPYCARVRIQMYHKNLPVTLTPPPGGSSSAEYRKFAILGRVPALELDGAVIAESLAIMEYLEDRFPAPALRPAKAEQLARMRTLCQANDHYVMPALRALVVLSREDASQGALASAAEELKTQLSQLQELLDEDPYAVGDQLTLADCTLAPAFHFTTEIPAMLGLKPLLRELPNLNRLWETLTEIPSVNKVRNEITVALKNRSHN